MHNFLHNSPLAHCAYLIIAKKGVDYKALFVVSQFTSSMVSSLYDVRLRCLFISLVNDDNLEHNEYFIATLSVSDPIVTIKNNVTIITIIDDDG